MSEFDDSIKHKNNAYEVARKESHEAGDLSLSGENSRVAENQTEWEIGGFHEAAEKKNPDNYRDGLIVRARKNALEAARNSGQSLDRLVEIEAKLDRISKTQWVLLVFLVVLFLVLIFR